MDLKRQIGTRVRAARRTKKLTQEALGGLIGRTTETVSNIERGETLPTLPTLEVLSRHLAVPLAEFFVTPEKAEKASKRRSEIDFRIRDLLATLSDEAAEMVVAQVELVAEYERVQGRGGKTKAKATRG